MILISHNKQARDAWESFTDAERAKGYQVHADLHNDLVESGEMVVAEALADPAQAKRILVSDGRATTTDGPFPEVKEHLAGFYMVDVDSVETAIEYAARIPEARYGLVEVRPVLGNSGTDL
ncbi:YciI family protein [Dactylosporangium sp. NPDC000555]|uniref:YciI family protein n=1 Tax=Dactylosporangium sp. NPDC000555 TaxID=3154260 RepID=UPI003319B29F